MLIKWIKNFTSDLLPRREELDGIRQVRTNRELLAHQVIQDLLNLQSQEKTGVDFQKALQCRELSL